jgi:peptide/nickel transport system permease protein
MKPLQKYLLKRVAAYIVTLYGAVTAVFFLFRLIPGNPIEAFIGQIMATQFTQAELARKLVEQYKAEFGLEGDLFTQYVNYMRQLLRGNFGVSLYGFPRSAQELIFQSLPWTIGLLGLSAVISWFFGVVLGALTAWKRESKVGAVLAGLAIVFSQIPYYIIAVTLVLVFSYMLGWLPATGAYDPSLSPGLNIQFILSVIKYGLLPALSLVLTQAFGWFLSTRYLTISLLGEDFLVYAEAKGIKQSRLFRRYVFRNILLPQTTGLGISLGFMIGGQIVLETIFAYPGMGYLFSRALGMLDYNLISGILILQSFVVLTANLILDLVYPLIDPRVKYHE